MAHNDTSSTETVHPLRAAVGAAEAELETAREAREALDDDDTVAAEDPRYEAALERESAADVALDEAREALEGSDCPREWTVTEEGGGEFWSGTATSAAEAIGLADPSTDPADFGDENKTQWYTVHAHCEETTEQDSRTIEIEPVEPDCTNDDGHDWQSPLDLVGGIKENPGVYGSGGGVVIHEACVRCGCRRTTDTWAQRPDTGEQGLTSVEYEEGYYDVSAYAARGLMHEVVDAGCSEAIEAAACLLHGLRTILDGGDYEGTPPGTPHELRIDEVLAYLDRVYRAVPTVDEDRALRLALRIAADGEREHRIADAVISAQWPADVRAAA